MNYIILDLEFNQPYTNKYGIKVENKDCPFEIMEIGAVKLNEHFDTIDTFRIYIKPIYYHKVSMHVCKKTKIKNTDLQYGFEFPKAIDEFKKWIGEEYIIYTWSDNDYKIMQLNCNYHNIELSWFKYIDLQEEYRIFKHYVNSKSLKKAVQEIGIPMSNDFHKALGDAKYTAEILKFIKGIKINTVEHDISGTTKYKNLYKTKETKIINSNKYKQVRCPICGKFSKRIEMSRKFSANNKFVVLAFCNHCKCKIQQSAKKVMKSKNKDLYIVATNVVDDNTFRSVMEQIK